MFLFRTAILFFLTSISLLFISQASAITINPVRYLVTINAGDSRIVSVNVKNDEGVEKVFKFSVLGAMQDEKGRPLFKQDIDIAETWVRPENEQMAIKPAEEKEVKFIIIVPAGAGPGAHYLGLAVEDKGGGGNVGLSGRLLTLLNLQVSGIVKEDLKIEKWQSKHKITCQKKWPFSLEIKNNSNIDVSLEGGTTVHSWTGKEIFRQPIKIGNSLLPDTKRVLETDVYVGGQIFWPGYYKIKSMVVYGRTQQIASAEFGILYVPWWSLLIIGLLVLLIGGERLRKRNLKF